MRSYLAFLALTPGAPTPVQPFEGDDKLKFIGIKFTLDGSTQGFTAALKIPYLNTSESGTLNFPSTTNLIATARPFFDQGWQISCHANGDRAVDQALDVYQSLLANTTDKIARRLRIEHFTVTEESQLDRVKQLGLTISMTIGHVFFWGQVFDQVVLGPQRAQRIDPAGSLKSRGVRYSFHSDSTVTSVNPLRYIQNAVTRVPQLNPPSVLGADQAITIDDGLRAETLDAAYQLFIDDKVGSLEVGKYADMIILDRNPRTVSPDQLTQIKITDVFLAGKRQGP